MANRDVQLQEGNIYKNRNGGEYLCRSVYSHGARLRNVKSGWDFEACVITEYEDGTIEWDYSINGSFAFLR